MIWCRLYWSCVAFLWAIRGGILESWPTAGCCKWLPNTWWVTMWHRIDPSFSFTCTCLPTHTLWHLVKRTHLEWHMDNLKHQSQPKKWNSGVSTSLSKVILTYFDTCHDFLAQETNDIQLDELPWHQLQQVQPWVRVRVAESWSSKNQSKVLIFGGHSVWSVWVASLFDQIQANISKTSVCATYLLHISFPAGNYQLSCSGHEDRDAP